MTVCTLKAFYYNSVYSFFSNYHFRSSWSMSSRNANVASAWNHRKTQLSNAVICYVISALTLKPLVRFAGSLLLVVSNFTTEVCQGYSSCLCINLLRDYEYLSMRHRQCILRISPVDVAVLLLLDCCSHMLDHLELCYWVLVALALLEHFFHFV